MPDPQNGGGNIVDVLEKFHKVHEGDNAPGRDYYEAVAKKYAGREAELWEKLYTTYEPDNQLGADYYQGVAAKYDNPYAKKKVGGEGSETPLTFKLLDSRDMSIQEYSLEDVIRNRDAAAKITRGKPFSELSTEEQNQFNEDFFGAIAKKYINASDATPEQIELLGAIMGVDTDQPRWQNAFNVMVATYEGTFRDAIKGIATGFETGAVKDPLSMILDVFGVEPPSSLAEAKRMGAEVMLAKLAENPNVGTPEDRQKITAELEGIISDYNEHIGRELEENPLMKWSKADEFLMNVMHPTNPQFADEFWATKLPAGVGSMAAFATVEALTKPIAPIPGVASATLGSLSTASQEFEKAFAETGDVDKAMDAFNVGLVVGGLEGVLFLKGLGTMNKFTKGAFGQRLKWAMSSGGAKILQSGSEEAIQEMITDVTLNLSAREIYDASQELLTDETLESGAIGFILGSGMGAVNAKMDHVSGAQKELLEAAKDNFVEKGMQILDQQIAQMEAKADNGITTRKELEALTKLKEKRTELQQEYRSDGTTPEITEVAEEPGLLTEDAPVPADVPAEPVTEEYVPSSPESSSLLITEGNGTFEVERTPEGLKITKEGKEIPSNHPQRGAVVEQYRKQILPEIARENVEVEITPEMGPQEVTRKIASESVSPVELATEYLNVTERQKSTRESGSKEAIISEKLEKFPISSFDKYGSDVEGRAQIRTNYINNEGTPIDVQAESMSEGGVEITPEDIVQFVNDHPGGQQLFGSEQENIDAIASKFEELTGVPITPEYAEQVRDTYYEGVFNMPSTDIDAGLEGYVSEEGEIDYVGLRDNLSDLSFVTEENIGPITTYLNEKGIIPAEEGGVEPVEEGTGTAGETGKPGERKKRSFAKRVEESPELEPEVGEGLSDEGRYYEPIGNFATQTEANILIDEQGPQKAFNTIRDRGGAVSPRVRVAVAENLIKRHNETAEKATTEAEKNKALDDAIAVAEWAAEYGTILGQGVQAFAMWSRITPDGALRYLSRAVNKGNELKKEGARSSYQAVRQAVESGNERAVNEVIKSKSFYNDLKKAFKSMFGGKTKAFGKTKKEIQDKKAEALDKFKAALKDKAQTGINPEAFTALVEYGFYVVADGVVTFKEWVKEMRAATGMDDDTLRKVWEENGVKEAAEKQLSATDIDKAVDRIKTIASDHYTKDGTKSLGDKISEALGLSESDAKKVEKIIKAEVGKRSKNYTKSAIDKTVLPKNRRKNKGAIDKVLAASQEGAVSEQMWKNFLAEMAGVDKVSPEMADKIRKMAEEVRARPNGFMREQASAKMLAEIEDMATNQWVKGADIAWSLWYAGILSGPNTQLLNIASNVMNTVLETFVTTLEKGVISRDPQAVVNAYKGLFAGYKRGAAQAANVMRTGYEGKKGNKQIEVQNALEKLEKKGDWKDIFRVAAMPARFVGRFMQAVDLFFYHGLLSKRYQMLAYAESKRRGMTGPKLRESVSEILGNTEQVRESARQQVQNESIAQEERTGKGYTRDEKRLRESEIIEQSYPEDMREDGNHFASFGTFNYQPTGTIGLLAKSISNAQNASLTVKGKDYKPLKITKTIIPFTGVVANVLNQQLDYTPYGYLRAFKGGLLHSQHKPETVEQRNRQLIKATIGLAGMSMLWMMHDDSEDSQFEITGGGPADYDEHSQWLEAGKKPYSVKIGNKWVSYQYSPLGIAMSIIGNSHDAVKYNGMDPDDVAMRLGFGIQNSGSTILEYSFLTGLKEFMEMFTDTGDPEKRTEKMLRFFQKRAGSVVPNLFKQVDKWFDPTVYQSDDIYESLMREIPVVRETQLKPRLNVLGEPIRRKGGRFSSTETADPLWKLVSTKRVKIPVVSKSIKLSGESVTDGQYREFIERRGKIMRREIEARIGELSAMTTAELDKFVKDLDKEARKVVKKDMDDKKSRRRKKKTTKKKTTKKKFETF